MYYRHDEYALLSRGGRLPAPARPPRPPIDLDRRYRSREPRLPRLRGAVGRLSARAPVRVVATPPRQRIEIHEYLELEFTLDDRR